MSHNLAEACGTLSLSSVFNRFCAPGRNPRILPAGGGQRSGDMVKHYLVLLERGFTQEKRTSQNGCGVAPTVVTEVTDYIP